MKPRYVILLLAALLWGCAGVVSQSHSVVGNAQLNISWPERTRLIPLRAESVKIEISGPNQFSQTQVVTRPAANQSTTTPIRFSNLPVGLISITASAYPNPDATGTVQASGIAFATVVSRQTVSATVTMASTVTSVNIAPTTDPAVNFPTTVFATPLDSQGRVVLVHPDTLTWSAGQNCAISGPTTGASVTFSCAAAGPGSLSVQYTEPGANPPTGTWNFNAQSGIGITVSPTSGVINRGLSQLVSGTVTGNGGITWTVLGPGQIQSSSSTQATIVSTADTGTIEVKATSIEDPSKTATAFFEAAPPVSVTLNPTGGDIAAGLDFTLTSSVQHTQNSSVTWAVSGATLVSSTATTAIVRAPATPGTFSVTATSTHDPSKATTANFAAVSGSGSAGGTVRSPIKKGGRN